MPNIIRMPKRFDYSASADFNAALLAIFNSEGEGCEVALDCLGMDYIDSAGIGLLVMAHKKALANQSTITITNAKPSTKEILLLANLQKLIEIN